MASTYKLVFVPIVVVLKVTFTWALEITPSFHQCQWISRWLLGLVILIKSLNPYQSKDSCMSHKESMGTPLAIHQRSIGYPESGVDQRNHRIVARRY